MIRANFMTEEEEEKLSTLAGLCPRVSGHVKSQGSRSQPSLTSRSGIPESAALATLISRMHGDLSGVKSIPQKWMQTIERTRRLTALDVTEFRQLADWTIDMHKIDVAKQKIRILRLKLAGPVKRILAVHRS